MGKLVWMWCEEDSHSGDLLDPSRSFPVDAEQPGCPECPECGKPVHAQESSGDGIAPPQLVSLVERLKAQTRI